LISRSPRARTLPFDLDTTIASITERTWYIDRQCCRSPSACYYRRRPRSWFHETFWVQRVNDSTDVVRGSALVSTDFRIQLNIGGFGNGRSALSRRYRSYGCSIARPFVEISQAAVPFKFRWTLNSVISFGLAFRNSVSWVFTIDEIFQWIFQYISMLKLFVFILPISLLL